MRHVKIQLKERWRDVNHGIWKWSRWGDLINLGRTASEQVSTHGLNLTQDIAVVVKGGDVSRD
jgi:hypothetical protein